MYVYHRNLSYYLTNETLPFIARWIQVADIILNEINQTPKDKYDMLSLIKWELKFKEQEERNVYMY